MGCSVAVMEWVVCVCVCVCRSVRELHLARSAKHTVQLNREDITARGETTNDEPFSIGAETKIGRGREPALDLHQFQDHRLRIRSSTTCSLSWSGTTVVPTSRTTARAAAATATT